MFRSPSWVVCRSDSPPVDRRVFSDSAKESPGVEVAHFVRVGSVDSVLRGNKEFVTAGLRVKSPHDA